jgi:hypothetical protein
LPIELKVHGEQAAVQKEKHIFAFASDSADAAALGMPDEMRGRLRFYGDEMKDVNAADSAALDKRTKSANDSFHFWEFRHRRRCRITDRA